MGQVEIKNRQIWRDGKPVSLVNAEIHYWRLEPAVWPDMLQAAKEMGLETIAGYVQWHFHEYEPGKFDFRGTTDPKRDLVKYLDLVQESGLNLIIRPGPYTFAEWDNYGLPDYIASYHRLHPEFLKSAGRYIARVCQVIKPYLATQGGPIIMLQPDNMYDLGQHRYDHQLGLLGGQGVFQEYLIEKYGSIERLNEAWDASYDRFDQTMAAMTLLAGDAAARVRFLDFLDFKLWFSRRAAEWTVTQYRGGGIDVPFYVNATYDQDYEAMSEVLDILGFNHYPTRDYCMGHDEHRFMLDQVRLLPMISELPFIVELESGIWHGYHYKKGMPYPDHYRFMLLTVLAGGAVAWTWYMFHDRDNWFMSPVNNLAKKHLDVFDLFAQFTDLAKEHKPETWERCTESALSFSQRHYSSHILVPDYFDAFETGMAFYESGIDHGYYSTTVVGKTPKVLFYDGLEWLDRAGQEALVDYVEQGGHLVVFQTFPQFDELGNPCNLLEIPRPDGVDSQGYMSTFYADYIVRLGAHDARVELPDGVFVYRQVPGEPITATRVPTRGQLNDSVLEEYQYLTRMVHEEAMIVGYRAKRGKGSLVFLGLPPTPELVKTVHQFLGIPIPARPLTPKAQAVLFRRGKRHYLIVLNVGFEARGVEILLDPSEFPELQYVAKDLLTGREKSVLASGGDTRTLTVQVPGRNGAIYEICPADRRDVC
jgi:hypothetical protein